MKFQPLKEAERDSLLAALKGNAAGAAGDTVAGGIRINPDTTFGGAISPDDVLAATERASDDAVINAIMSVPTHYTFGDDEAAIMRGLTLPAPLCGEVSGGNYVAATPGAGAALAELGSLRITDIDGDTLTASPSTCFGSPCLKVVCDVVNISPAAARQLRDYLAAWLRRVEGAQR